MQCRCCFGTECTPCTDLFFMKLCNILVVQSRLMSILGYFLCVCHRWIFIFFPYSSEKTLIEKNKQKVVSISTIFCICSFRGDITFQPVSFMALPVPKHEKIWMVSVYLQCIVQSNDNFCKKSEKIWSRLCTLFRCYSGMPFSFMVYFQNVKD